MVQNFRMMVDQLLSLFEKLGASEDTAISEMKSYGGTQL